MKKLTALLLSLLFLCVFAGCGAADTTSEPSFTPDTVRLSMGLSSGAPRAPITDAETVADLWSVYQGLELDDASSDSTEPKTWDIDVTFEDSKTGASLRFTIFDCGICWLNDDYETDHYATNGKDAFLAFLTAFEEAPEA